MFKGYQRVAFSMYQKYWTFNLFHFRQVVETLRYEKSKKASSHILGSFSYRAEGWHENECSWLEFPCDIATGARAHRPPKKNHLVSFVIESSKPFRSNDMLHGKLSISCNPFCTAGNFDFGVTLPIIYLVSKKSISRVFHCEDRAPEILSELIKEHHIMANILCISVEVNQNTLFFRGFFTQDFKLFKVYWVKSVQKYAGYLVMHLWSVIFTVGWNEDQLVLNLIIVVSLKEI